MPNILEMINSYVVPATGRPLEAFLAAAVLMCVWVAFELVHREAGKA